MKIKPKAMTTPKPTAGASDTAQHTAGPFTFRVDLAKAFVGFWTVPIFSGQARVGIGRGPTLEIAIANARLIAAAPELLAALKSAVAHYQIRCDIAERLGVTAPTKESWVPAARAALAKAKGEK